METIGRVTKSVVLGLGSDVGLLVHWFKVRGLGSKDLRTCALKLLRRNTVAGNKQKELGKCVALRG